MLQSGKHNKRMPTIYNYKNRYTRFFYHNRGFFCRSVKVRLFIYSRPVFSPCPLMTLSKSNVSYIATVVSLYRISSRKFDSNNWASISLSVCCFSKCGHASKLSFSKVNIILFAKLVGSTSY